MIEEEEDLKMNYKESFVMWKASNLGEMVEASREWRNDRIPPRSHTKQKIENISRNDREAMPGGDRSNQPSCF